MSDHKTESVQHIQEAVTADRNGNWQTAQFEVKLALVEATLAVAEQQRIANLLTFHSISAQIDLTKRPDLYREIKNTLGLQ